MLQIVKYEVSSKTEYKCCKNPKELGGGGQGPRVRAKREVGLRLDLQRGGKDLSGNWLVKRTQIITKGMYITLEFNLKYASCMLICLYILFQLSRTVLLLQCLDEIFCNL